TDVPSSPLDLQLAGSILVLVGLISGFGLSRSIAVEDLDEAILSQLLQILLASIVGAFHSRRAADRVLHIGIFELPQLGLFLIVEAYYLKSVLESNPLGHIAGFESRDCRSEIFLEFPLLECAELAVLSA